jgi:EpsI family protein
MVFVSKGRRKMLVWNWYIAGSLVTADFYRQQLQLLKDELCSGKGEGALVTLSTMLDNDDAQQANAANTDFTRVLLPLLRSHEQSQAVVD